MRTMLRLTARRLHWEFGLTLLAGVVLVLLTAVTIAMIAGGGDAPSDTWLQLASLQLQTMFAFPVFLGVIAGTSLIAPEFDRGTSQFVASIVVARRRWFVEVLLAGWALIGVGTLPLAVACFALEMTLGQQRMVGFNAGLVDPAPLMIVVRGIASLTIAAVAGAVLRRSLPTLVASAMVAALLLAAFEGGAAAARQAGIVTVDPANPMTFYMGDRFLGPDGKYLDNDRVYAEQMRLDQEFLEVYTIVAVGLDPQERTLQLAIELGSLAAAIALLAAAGVEVTKRRRPV
jgi:hypothetical protein